MATSRIKIFSLARYVSAALEAAEYERDDGDAVIAVRAAHGVSRRVPEHRALIEHRLVSVEASARSPAESVSTGLWPSRRISAR